MTQGYTPSSKAVFAFMAQDHDAWSVLPLQTRPITIRPADVDDELAVRRLAALDSAPVPRGALVLAEVEGELRVAVSSDGCTAIADPFHRTRELVALVRDYAVRVTAAA
jgi:hypothetical protein